MDLKKLVDNLELDLINEYKHLLFYLHSSSLIVGLNRKELKEFLFSQAENEMKHVSQFTELIVGLGRNPDIKFDNIEKEIVPSLSDPVLILEKALSIEKEVVNNYLTRIQEAEQVGGIDGKYIELFLEDQLIDSRNDIDKIKRMLS